MTEEEKAATEGKLQKEAASDQDALAWEEIHTEHIIQDEWIDFRRSAYRFPDGSVFEPYYSYSRRDYVVIVASDTEGNYLCVRQFRQGIQEVTTEFPAGGIERKDGKEYGGSGDFSSEDALAAAKRELLEETGYESGEWRHLLTVPSNATIADNYAHLFAAGNCRRVSGQALDETEFLNVVKLSAQEIEGLIAEGGFQQAVHIAAWLLAIRG
ncbi:MAG: NUDIX hydrolase [Roseburia sp.]|nr:NUDIX hydrolase [Roseburia sp.]MCM1099717.1 NUDIX hydrolase [Ruminococcus flavefaciens]